MSTLYYQPYKHYEFQGIQRPRPTKKDIWPCERFTVSITVPEGKKLLWDFTTRGEIEFFVHKGKDERDVVFPYLRLTSAIIPEEGELQKVTGGEYTFVFANPNLYFITKLEYGIAVV